MTTNPLLGGAPGAYTHSKCGDTVISVMLVDARVRVAGPWSQTCKFVGTGESPDKTRKCKHYEKSSQRKCCVYFRDDLDTAVCDCRKE